MDFGFKYDIGSPLRVLVELVGYGIPLLIIIEATYRMVSGSGDITFVELLQRAGILVVCSGFAWLGKLMRKAEKDPLGIKDEDD